VATVAYTSAFITGVRLFGGVVQGVRTLALAIAMKTPVAFANNYQTKEKIYLFIHGDHLNLLKMFKILLTVTCSVKADKLP